MADSLELTHFDEKGAARMVDVSAKETTRRLAIATGVVTMGSETLRRILDRSFSKGDVLEVARIAGIMAAKRVDSLIPLCHQLNLSSVTLDFTPHPETRTIHITAQVTTNGQTGVEMEALMAVSIAALTIYDMCKSVDRDMEIGRIRLLEKKGGKSGHYVRSEG